MNTEVKPKLPDPTVEESSESEDTKAQDELAFHKKLQDARLRSFEQTVEQRKEFSTRVFWLIIGWLFVVVLILLAHGFCWFGRELPESALLALIGSTTFNVLGLLVIVLKYVFSPHPLDAKVATRPN